MTLDRTPEPAHTSSTAPRRPPISRDRSAETDATHGSVKSAHETRLVNVFRMSIRISSRGRSANELPSRREPVVSPAASAALSSPLRALVTLGAQSPSSSESRSVTKSRADGVQGLLPGRERMLSVGGRAATVAVVAVAVGAVFMGAEAAGHRYAGIAQRVTAGSWYITGSLLLAPQRGGV